MFGRKWLWIPLLVALFAAGLALLEGASWRDFGTSGKSAEPDSVDAGKIVGAGEVDIDGGPTPLTPLASGRVTKLLVREGDSVVANAPLIQLDFRLAQLALRQAEAAIQEAQVRLEQARQAVHDHRHLVKEQAQALEVAEARRQAQQRQVDRLEKLRPTAAVSEENYLAARDRARELDAALKIEREKLESLRPNPADRSVRLAEIALSQARLQAESAREQLDRHTLRAPAAGVVLRVLVRVGQTITAGAAGPAIWFQPDEPLVVRCEIEQEFANGIEPGLKALIADDADPGRQWRGQVRRAARWVAARRNLTLDPFQSRDAPTVETIIDLEPSTAPPRLGQRVRATIFPPPAAAVHR